VKEFTLEEMYSSVALKKESHTEIVASTLLGNGRNGYTDGNISDNNLEFNGPYGVIEDKDGENIYIADKFNYAIRRYKKSDGTLTTILKEDIFPSANDIHNSIKFPSGFAFDKVGNLYYTDAGLDCVKKILVSQGDIIEDVTCAHRTREIERLDRKGAPLNKVLLGEPTGIAIDNEGNIYITEKLHHIVSKLHIAENTIEIIAGTWAGFKDGPCYSSKFNSKC